VAKLANGVEVTISSEHPVSGQVTLALRPERLTLHTIDAVVSEGRNVVKARVSRRTYFGDVFFYDVDLGLDEPMEVKEENRPDLDRFEVGDEVLVSWRPSAANLVTD
jgi:ABC-type Fe3+/spermidine/putrescine transport system ATPase subunit